MAKRHTDFPNGVKAFPRDKNAVTKTGSYTVVIADCLGKTIIMDSASAATFTLPILTSVKGGIVTLVNNKKGQLLTIDPNAADGIAFGDQTTDGVTIVNTAATAEKGDYVTLASIGAGATAATFWSVVEISGTWAVGA